MITLWGESRDGLHHIFTSIQLTMEFDSCISFRSGQQQAQMKTSRTHIRAKTPFFHQKAEQRVRNKAVNITMLATACNIWIHAMWLEWVWCTAPQMGLYLETFKSRSYIGEFCQLHRKSVSWSAGSNNWHMNLSLPGWRVETRGANTWSWGYEFIISPSSWQT